jgi:hypothetical protein
MSEEKEENKTIYQNATGNRQNTVDRTIDVLRLSSTIIQNIIVFLSAGTCLEFQFSAANLLLHPFSDNPCARSEILSIEIQE